MNNQEKNTYVRQHILSALLELMETQEFASISIQALVDAAGVGRASFYRNFASKEDVLQQESVRLTNEWKTKFDQEHPDGTPGPENLWLIVLCYFQVTRHDMFRSASCCYNIVTAMNQTSRAEKRKEKQKMYTVTFSNEELEEMKANDAVVIVSCDDDNGHRLY